MKLTRAFWDSSALTPLFLPEASSSRARALHREFPPAVWWATPVEIRSSIARLVRFGKIDLATQMAVVHRLQRTSDAWHWVSPVDSLRSLAETLLDEHPLRAADSLQLAAALAWCNHKPTRRTFVCSDIRLSEAAAQAGFTVVTP